MHRNARTIALVLLASLIAGCAEDNPAPLAPTAKVSLTDLDPPRENVPGATVAQPRPLFVEPDFSLADVNPNSATHDQNVSPRAGIGKITAWYFGAAT